MVDTVIVEAETPAVPAVSWPAIVAGGFVAAAFTLLLLALGSGIGFSVISPWSGLPDITTTKAALVGGIYMAVTAVMGSALGGYVTGRLRVRWTRAPLDEVYFRDTAHGVLAWAFATVMGAALLASAATVVGSAAAGGRDLAADRDVARRMLLTFRERGHTELSADDRQYLVQMVVARTGLPQTDAEHRVAAVEADARTALDNAQHIAMQLSFWLVAAMFLGAFAAGLAATEGGAARDGR